MKSLPSHSRNAAPEEEAQCSSNRLPSTLHPTPSGLTCTLHWIGGSVARNWGCLAFRSYFRSRAIFRRTKCNAFKKFQKLDAHSTMSLFKFYRHFPELDAYFWVLKVDPCGFMVFKVALLSQSVAIDSASRYLFELTVSHHEEQLLRNFTEQLLARDAFLWVSVLEYISLCARYIYIYLISILYSMNIYQSYVDCPDSWHHSWHLAQKLLNMGSWQLVRFSTVIYVYYMSLGIGVGCRRAGGEKRTYDLDSEIPCS